MKHKLLILLLIIISIVGGVFLFLKASNKLGDSKGSSEALKVAEESGDVDLQIAIEAGRGISKGECEGSGPVELTHSPMDPEDFSILIPYGVMIGGHVTPIDHQYFAPKDTNSPRDVYEVYAIADGFLNDIQPRARVSMTDPNDKFDEYRIVFSHSCTLYSYYDLVTSLAPDVKAEYDKVKNGDGSASSMNYKVKAGDLIGYIGGQTLDFAVWDTQKTLTGFITPELYKAESWKIYTANPYDYYSEELKELLTERNPRTVAPIQGKIDYDVDGKLIGNWFVKDSGGYNTGGGSDYWKNHVSFAPNVYDPAKYIISIGDFGGRALQFAIKGNLPDPLTVGTSSGLIKYDLVNFHYEDADGKKWFEMDLIKNPKLTEDDTIRGCALAQMTANNRLKFESFPDQSCDEIESFSGEEKVFER